MIRTLGDLFLQAVARDRSDCLLVRQGDSWTPVSSREFHRRVVRAHLLLKSLGLQKGDRVALLSENRWEWAVADFAMMTAGIVSVPLYVTLAADQIRYMLEDSGSRAAFASSAEQKTKVASTGCVICFDEDRWISDAPLSDAERREFDSTLAAVAPGDLASIIYTSGTTGVPKGVMLTHANLASNAADTDPDVEPGDVAVSFLPLCHIFERIVDYCYYLKGAAVAHVGVMEQVPEALREIRPTHVAAVPRFFEKMYARVMESVTAAPSVRRKLFHWAMKTGFASIPFRMEGKSLPPLLGLRYALADRLVFSKLRARLGGRIKLFISGGAPLGRDLAEFFYAAGILICEGYGLTETSPVISTNRPGQVRLGTVGKPIRNVEVRIAEDGEILVRGPNVMKGYWRMERETAEVMEGGWFHTGDIGMLDADGYLRILDRKKDLLKTSGGKYITPAPIENKLKSSPLIADAVVIADQRRFPSALIVPDFARLQKLARELGLPDGSPAELARHPEIVRRIEQDVERLCSSLAGYEKIKKVAVLDREFTIAAGEITPTMKVRRREVEKRYRDVIEKIYEEPAA